MCGGGGGGGVAAAAGAGATGAAMAVVAAMAGGERPEMRVEIGVPRSLLGDYLALVNRFHVYKLATIWCT